MIPRLLPGLVALASVLLVACYPVQENRPHRQKPGSKPNPPAVTQTEQAKIKEQQERQRRAEEEKIRQAEAEQQNTDLPSENGANPPDGVTKPEPKRVDYPVAQKAPGKEGFVLSPYNSKIIDVRDDAGKPLARGTLVQDPTYSASEKKYFRVP